jgi:hypothetical protein
MELLKGASLGKALALIENINNTGKPYKGQTLEFIEKICKLL